MVKRVLLGILFWLWSLTWGALMTIPGLLITGFCILFLHGKPHKNGFSYIVEIGGNWGGLELGAVALCGSYNTPDNVCFDPIWYEYIRRHEFGHNVQQLLFGPLQLFIVGIPSAIRYHYRNKYPEKVKTEYDDIWFEGTATRWGTKAINWIEGVE